MTVRRMQNEATPLALEDSMISRAIQEMARTACGMPAKVRRKRDSAFSAEFAGLNNNSVIGMVQRGTLNLENFKSEVHRTLISKLDLEKLSRVNSNQARQAVSSIISEIISDRRVPLSFDEQEKIQTDLLDEVFGLGSAGAVAQRPEDLRHPGQRQGSRLH